MLLFRVCVDSFLLLPFLCCTDILAKRSESAAVRAEEQQQETEPEPKAPPGGNFYLIVALSPQGQDRCLNQVPGDSDRASYESLALGCVTLQLGGRDAYAYGLCMPYSNPTKPQPVLGKL